MRTQKVTILHFCGTRQAKFPSSFQEPVWWAWVSSSCRGLFCNCKIGVNCALRYFLNNLEWTVPTGVYWHFSMCLSTAAWTHLGSLLPWMNKEKLPGLCSGMMVIQLVSLVPQYEVVVGGGVCVCIQGCLFSSVMALTPARNSWTIDPKLKVTEVKKRLPFKSVFWYEKVWHWGQLVCQRGQSLLLCSSKITLGRLEEEFK